MTNIIKRVKEVTASALNAVPSPEGCGCGKRKRQMQANLREDKSLSDIIGDLVDDLRGKTPS